MAAALTAYGAAGLLLLAAAATAIAPSIATLEALARSSGDVRETLAATRDAFDGFASSVVEGARSAERAAASARSSAAAARRLSDAMAINVFGTQPLLPLASGFLRQSEDLQTLALQLDELAAELAENEGDVRAIRDGIAALHERTTVLAGSPTASGAGWVGPIAFGLIAWLGLQAVAALWAGVAMLRAAR